MTLTFPCFSESCWLTDHCPTTVARQIVGARSNRLNLAYQCIDDAEDHRALNCTTLTVCRCSPFSFNMARVNSAKMSAPSDSTSDLPTIGTSLGSNRRVSVHLRSPSLLMYPTHGRYSPSDPTTNQPPPAKQVDLNGNTPLTLERTVMTLLSSRPAVKSRAHMSF